MKWGIVILLILGAVAAASAAVLMGALSISSSGPDEKQSDSIEVAMAKVSLPAATVITIELINQEMVSRDELPKGNLAGPLQILGRVLAVPVVEGQVLTESCFVREGVGAILASQIPHGMRAISIPVTSKVMPDRILLYPGCVVDVVVAYKLTRNPKGEALSQTMLRGIHVLAISGDSVVSKPEEEGGAKKRSSNRGMLVTLLVAPNQVEALQLAAENGNLTMSLRNPLDKKPVPEEGTFLNRNSLANKGDMLTPTVPNEQDLPGEQRFDGDNPQGQRVTPYNPSQEGSGDGVYQNRKNSRWEVEIILGREKKVKDFDAPENKTDKTAPEK